MFVINNSVYITYVMEDKSLFFHALNNQYLFIIEAPEYALIVPSGAWWRHRVPTATRAMLGTRFTTAAISFCDVVFKPAR